MAKKGKNYRKAAEDIDTTKMYSLDEGVELALKGSYAKFDESVDIAIRLGVDPRHADQMVRSSVVLPNGTGKEIRVLVFAKGEKEKEPLDAGADFAGGDEFVEKIQSGWLEFD
ncbi:MAG: 50S ribosomal protein L1, partial [Desulfobulbaceae bacterium]